MPLSTRPAAAALVASLMIATTAHAQGSPLHRDTVAAVDRVFARYSATTPGCAVGIARGGQEILARGYGLAELEHRVPITPATIFEAGSVSKQFTAFLALLLEQEGRLSLDDPLRKYLPELPDYGAPLTIRQVLNHTSGLRDWYGIASVQGLRASERHFGNDDLLEMASRQRSLNFPSGTEYLYSNTGWNILAIAIERITGESFQEASRRRIFEPLGIRMQQRARLANGTETDYGLGLSIRNARGIPEVGHGGATGGYRSQAVRFPTRQLSIAILCNETGANVADANAIADLFLGAAPVQQAGADSADSPAPPRWAPDAVALREYVGESHTDEAPATWSVVANRDTLVLHGPARRRIVLRPESRDTFDAPGLGTVVFRRDDAGRITAVSFRMGRLRDIRLARR